MNNGNLILKKINLLGSKANELMTKNKLLLNEITNYQQLFTNNKNYITSYFTIMSKKKKDSKIHTYTEEKCILAEEIGHYFYNAYYTLNSSKEDIDKAEYKAMKWKSLACITPQSILSCFYKRNM